MLRLRLQEHPMPTGSKDPDVLLAWLLDSLGIVRRKRGGFEVGDTQGALHSLLRHHILLEPLRCWDSRGLSEESGISSTALHHQLTKLVESGLISVVSDSRWRLHFLRNGSLANAVMLIQTEVIEVLRQRLLLLDDVIEASDERMRLVLPEDMDDDMPFRIIVTECGPRDAEADDFDALIRDLGLDGDRPANDDKLARQLLTELSEQERPRSMHHLMDDIGATRPRLQRTLDRMRAAGIVERVPLADRLPQDIFAGLARQRGARGESWLLGRGGVGRLEAEQRDALMKALQDETLTIEITEQILVDTTLEQRLLLLNTLGGRVPFGHRLTGKDGAAVRGRMMFRAERVLSRLVRIAEQLDSALCKS